VPMDAPKTRRFRRAVMIPVMLFALLCAGALAFAAKHIAAEQSAYSGPTAAQCVPAKLNVSDLLARTDVQVAPLPGSYDAMPETQISFLGVPAGDLHGIAATGSFTGAHPGRLEPYSQGDGASFVPDRPFRSGERVTVQGKVRTESGLVPFSYSFNVAYPDPIPYKTELPKPRATPPSGSVLDFHSAPQLQAPSIDVSTDASNATPGDIFLAPYSGPGPDGPAIYTPQGQLVWMDPLPGEMKATNFQVQTYEGQPVLTWWQGYIPEQGFGLGEEIVADTSYRQILKIKAGNGNLADLHDFHLYDGSHTALMTVFRTIHCDLSSMNGPKDAAVTDTSFQELDVKTGLVRREWTAVDHVPLDESYSSALQSSTLWPFDYFHLNTIDPRANGTTLLSSRNTSALWLINDKTGQVIEKIGGKKSDVKMEPGAQTAFQHDAMTVPNGDISIFDNGGSPFGESYSENESRGVVVSVDEKAKTDTVVQELKHSPAMKAGSQGDVQLMSNGNWFVGWGQEPYFSEYSPSGQLIYDAHMWAVHKEFETESYRTYKFEWKATPYWPPSISAGKSGDRVEAWASWNGATEVAGWRLLGGDSAAALSPIASATSSGFETTLHGESKPYLAVQALNAAGEVIGTSHTISPS
jgi:Arylsulfotransferase (ASST)